MKYSKEFIDAQFKPKLSDKDFKHLVKLVREETDIIKVYDFLDTKLKDSRTKWVWLKKALKDAIDNG